MSARPACVLSFEGSVTRRDGRSTGIELRASIRLLWELEPGRRGTPKGIPTVEEPQLDSADGHLPGTQEELRRHRRTSTERR